MKSLFYALFFLAIIGLGSCSSDELLENSNIPKNPPTNVYVAVFGDIQYYTTSSESIDLYQKSIDWILNKSKEGMCFACVLHTGDITQSNSAYQYAFFNRATKQLATEIPFYSMIGNHDYTWVDRKITNRQSTLFNDYVKFPLSTQKVVAWFEKDRMENIVVDNLIYGQHYDLLILEFGPRKEVVAWANSIVKQHPERNYILMTHEYLEKGGGRRTSNLTCSVQFEGMNYLTPDQLWNQLIKCNDNIRLVLCGHVGGLYAVTIDTNDFGREIPQIQHNIQSVEYRYDNWLMLWDFPIESDSARVYIYNTNTGKSFNEQKSLFKFKYK